MITILNLAALKYNVTGLKVGERLQRIVTKENQCAWKVSVFRVFLVRIQSECGKTLTRKNSEYGHFSRSASVWRGRRMVMPSAHYFHVLIFLFLLLVFSFGILEAFKISLKGQQATNFREIFLFDFENFTLEMTWFMISIS